jgi:hypothetical protein
LNSDTFVQYRFKFDPETYTTEKFKGANSRPKYNYEKIHRIEEITEAVAEELESGAISFQVFGFPKVGGVDVSADVKEGAAATGALKRMATKKQAAYVDDFESEPEAAVVEKVEPARKASDKAPVNRMERKATLTEKKGLVLNQTETGAGGSTTVVTGKESIATVGVVKKEDSACCVMF